LSMGDVSCANFEFVRWCYMLIVVRRCLPFCPKYDLPNEIMLSLSRGRAAVMPSIYVPSNSAEVRTSIARDLANVSIVKF
jgi:hypothetical protein